LDGGLSVEMANQMVENAVGLFGLPLGLALNFVVNDRRYLVPMAVEEPSVIAADNCVFHDLALKDPEVCEFDLALLSTFTESRVDHQECMARGGGVCRFKFRPK